jgi:DNA-binding transcriptional ArsR family regulator
MRHARVSESVCRDRRISNAQFRVLALLLSYADQDTGHCHPKVGTLAGELSRTRSTIRHHLNRLVELGLITRDPMLRPDGSRGANRYRVLCVLGHEADPPPADRHAAQHFAPGDPLPDAAATGAGDWPSTKRAQQPALLLPLNGGQRTASEPGRKTFPSARPRRAGLSLNVQRALAQMEGWGK